jgi:hypothetical protein
MNVFSAHLWLAVMVDVELLAGEVLGTGEGGFGPAGVPVVAVGDEDGTVAVRLGPAGAVSHGHLPLLTDRLDREDLGPKADLLGKAEAPHVFVKVGGHLEVVRVVGIVSRHREGLVRHRLA